MQYIVAIPLARVKEIRDDGSVVEIVNVERWEQT
jgi:hypothetical protein